MSRLKLAKFLEYLKNALETEILRFENFLSLNGKAS